MAEARIQATAPTREQAHDLLRQMLLIRRFEEKASELYQLGKIRGFLHLYIGEEAVGVGAMQALAVDDCVVTTYRDHGHALARGLPAQSLMAEMYGKATGCSRGRGGSMHFFDVSRRFYGGYAIVGGGLPIAAGLALAQQMRRESNITACFFGEGAVAEGEFHETLNLAALWRLPILFLCENNLFAMGTALNVTLSETDIARRADSYGVPSITVDGMDVLAVHDAARQAVDDVRSGGGPRLLECRTYRFRGHSIADPELYREKGEVEEWKKRDPISSFQNWLLDRELISHEDVAQMEARISVEIDDAVQFAEESPWEAIEDVEKYVSTR